MGVVEGSPFPGHPVLEYARLWAAAGYRGPEEFPLTVMC